MDILRIAALGTAGVLLGITVKGAKPEFALLVTVGAGLCILAGTVGKMQYLLGMLAQMKSYLPVDSSYLNTLLKMLGITYVDSFPPGSVRMRAILPLQGRLNCSPAWRSLPSVCQCCSLCWKRFMIFCKKAGWGMALLFLCLIFGTGRTQKIEAAVQNVSESLEEESRLDTVGTDQETERAAVREKKGQQEKEAGDTETDQAAAQDELLAELDFDAIQQEVDSLLSSQQFSFAGTVRSLLQDGDPFRTFRAGNAVLSCAKTAFLAQKGLMKELFLLVLAGAVLGSFSSLFEGKQVRDASFYMVYLLALALILKNFQSSGENLKAVITSLVAFMRILTPSYYLAAAAAGGASSAVMFYQMLLLVILAVEKLLLALVLPMIHIYLLIALVNDLSGEEILSHMTELLETCVNGLLKSSLGVLVGMQMIRNLIAPALDSLRQMALWRTAGMIPGIGNAVNAVTELVAGSAVLIRNCFGVTAMLVLLAAGMVPAVQLLVSGLSFRLLAAAAQPVSDKRIAGCLAAAGKGYAMLLRLLLTVEVLFLLTIAILAGTFS